MNIFRKAGRYIGQSVIWFDRFINYTIGKCRYIWSDYGGKSNETISSTLGAEEAEALYKLWVAGIPYDQIKDVLIEDKHILGEFSSDLCDLFQRYHALRSITWRKEKTLLTKYPGIDKVVTDFLLSKGIKD